MRKSYRERATVRVKVAVALCASTFAILAKSSQPSVDLQFQSPGEAVGALVLNHDGKLMYGTLQNRQPTLRRLDPDGTPDPAFPLSAGGSGTTAALAVESDGSVLHVGGVLGGSVRRVVALGSSANAFSSSANNSILTVAVMPDGKILVGGSFTLIGGQSRSRIARLNSDGTVDPSFSLIANQTVTSLVVAPDGAVLAGGAFTQFGGFPRQSLARILPDGTVDGSFNPGVVGTVSCMVVQPDGRIVLGGSFSSVGGQPQSRLARISASGQVDANFNPTVDAAVNCLALETGGGVLVGGNFTSVNGLLRRHLARLRGDGSLDLGFNPSPDHRVHALVVEPEGHVLVGGSFTNINSSFRPGLARLLLTGADRDELVRNGEDSLLWRRGTRGVEVTQALFETSTNGSDWTLLGTGSRGLDGWEWTGAGAIGGSARVRGMVAGDGQGQWEAVQHQGWPVILSQPTPRTNVAGTSAEFRVLAGGSEPLRFRWFKDGVEMGETGSRTQLEGVLKANEGGYNVVVENDFGSVTSAVANLSVIDPSISGEPLDVALLAGQSSALEVQVTGTAPFGYQWFHNNNPVPAGGGPGLILNEVTGAEAGFYQAIVTNLHGAVTSRIAEVTVDATENFPGFTHQLTAHGTVSVSFLVPEPDGSFLFGGSFNWVDGQARYGLARLGSDGGLDPLFAPYFGTPYANPPINCVAVLPDGGFVVGGLFTSAGGANRQSLARFLPDRTLDPGFAASANSSVNALAVQPDGKIIVAGGFSQLNGQARHGVGRLHPDGTLDATFVPGSFPGARIVALQPDGKILISGGFSERLARLNADGSTDLTFQPSLNNAVLSIALQRDGKILIGGYFTTVSGLPRGRLARLQPDGGVDSTFIANAGGVVHSLSVLADGSILVAGEFAEIAGRARNRIALLEADGTLKSDFNPGADGAVHHAAAHTDGTLLLTGLFSEVGGQTSGKMARLAMPYAAVQNLIHQGNTITWQRSGGVPEIQAPTFEHTTDGLNWIQLGTATPVAGGWELSGVSNLASGTIRARGRVSGSGRSHWLVEDYHGRPILITQPEEQTTGYSGQVKLRAVAGGTGPLSYQWLKNGVPLTDNQTFLGATTSVLTVRQATGAQTGVYQLVASNAFGSTTSDPVTLAVTDPVMAVQPVDQTRTIGGAVVLNCEVLGTASVSCQWFHDGVPLPGANSPTLTIDPVQLSHAGSYYLEAAGPYGVTKSEEAVLTVNGYALDPEFDYVLDGSQAYVLAMAVQSDGKILAGGGFEAVDGIQRRRLVRFNLNGQIDDAFAPQPNGQVAGLAIQNDGLILAGGSFSSIGGATQRAIARLHPDGARDSSFQPVLLPTSANVVSVAIQPDGKILIAGSFTSVNGVSRGNIARLLPDGTLDSGFAPATEGSIAAMNLQNDGGIIVGGNFNSASGQPRTRLARFLADGSLDATFTLGVGYQGPASLAPHPAGSFLLGGEFLQVGGVNRQSLARITASHAVDEGYGPQVSGAVSTLAGLADGGVVAGGSIVLVNGVPRVGLARFGETGDLSLSLDPVSAPAGNTGVAVGNVVVTSGGDLVAGWSYQLGVGGTRYFRLTRWKPVVLGAQSIVSEAAGFKWQRSGAIPELRSVSFATSSDGGLSWVTQGEGVYQAGEWVIPNLSLPADATLRARGRVAGDGHSDWLLDGYYGRPFVSSQETTLTNLAGSPLRLAVATPEFPDLSYQWYKNGLPLSEGGNVSGASGPVLSLSAAYHADEGIYSVTVSNSFGEVTLPIAQVWVIDPAIVGQPESLKRELGESAEFSASARGSGTLSYQWNRNGIPIQGATATNLQLSALTAEDAGLYTLTVNGDSGVVTSKAAELVINQVFLDEGFQPDFVNTFATHVSSFGVQQDGQIVVGGSFNTVGGASRKSIARLEPDGGVDPHYNLVPNQWVRTVVVQEDGKSLLGGYFSTLNGTSRRLARLNQDGSIDSFAAAPNDWVEALAVQSDGKILVGGWFTSLGWSTATTERIGRLLPSGAVDNSFSASAGGIVLAIAPLSNGKVLIGGAFTNVSGLQRGRIARLNSDGSVDTTFNPGAGFDNTVTSLAVQADGKVIVGGSFGDFDGQPRAALARLHVDGSLDLTFAAGANGPAESIVIQADGRILLGGNMTSIGGPPRRFLVRLHPDGTVDSTFEPEFGGRVMGIGLQANGQILVGGDFSYAGGTPGNNLFVRLHNNVPVSQTLVRGDSSVTWLRGGGGPEVQHVRFRHSADGISWTPLGAGVRIPGGWSVDLPAPTVGGTVRASGYVQSGRSGASGWFEHLDVGAPVILDQPTSLTLNAGSTGVFRVEIAAMEGTGFQWFKDGQPLSDENGITGAHTASLTLSNVLRADAGNYHVVITGDDDSTTSAAAQLHVNDPTIGLQPEPANRQAGESVTFTGAAAGTPPLAYQWYRDLTPLAGATGATLTLHGLGGGDVGNYVVRVTNDHGYVDSLPALLTVNLTTVDSQFNPQFDSQFGLSVNALVPLTGGDALVGGVFSSIDGVTVANLARLAADGSAVETFSHRLDGMVTCLAMQTENLVLVGGSFLEVNGIPQRGLARMRLDGSLDLSFSPSFNGAVGRTIIQRDGKILVAGSFTTVNGISRQKIVRLHPDGTLDTSFEVVNGGIGGTGGVSSMRLAPDDSIYLAGGFTSVAGQPRHYLARLLADGNLDPTFNPTANSNVRSLALLADGRLLVGGEFTSIAGQSRQRIARLFADGTLDSTFAFEAGGVVAGLVPLADESVVVFGANLDMPGQPRNLLRLLPDGSVDPIFGSVVASSINTIAVERDGDLLLGGMLDAVDGVTRVGMARLISEPAAVESLNLSDSDFDWLRAGGGPEIWLADFAHSFDGGYWLPLGVGIYTPGGWKLAGVEIPAEHSIRARGYVAADASGWFVDRYLNRAGPIAVGATVTGGFIRLEWLGGLGPYQLQQTTSLLQPLQWSNFGAPLSTNGVNLPIGAGEAYFRVRGQ
jgi:uncharacterized delta-60 repeat protein